MHTYIHVCFALYDITRTSLHIRKPTLHTMHAYYGIPYDETSDILFIIKHYIICRAQSSMHTFYYPFVVVCLSLRRSLAPSLSRRVCVCVCVCACPAAAAAQANCSIRRRPASSQHSARCGRTRARSSITSTRMRSATALLLPQLLQLETM